MLVIYSIIIVLTFSAFGIVILDSYKVNRIKNEETRLFQTANIVADTYKGNIEDMVFTKTMVKSYGRQANARILVIDKEKRVILDNYNTYTGKTVDNEEVRSSLANKMKSGLYNLAGKDVLQLSVPVVLINSNKTEIIGAVLISASMETITKDTEGLKNLILKVSAFALCISLFLTYTAAIGITRPLKDLTFAVEKISSGELGYKVIRQEKGEIGKLIKTFNEMSEKLNNIEKNRKSFINSISHELKTPLASIIALIESLSIGKSDLETYKEYLSDIKDEAERMSGLVNYLIGSMKLEDISLDIKEEDIGEILEESLNLIKPYAEKNVVEINKKNIESIKIKCDKNKIKEVLLNLLDNGIKYSDMNKSYRFISASLETSGNRAILVIEDNGIGIENEDLLNIFSRGFRVLDASAIKVNGIDGYGIGLSIVKNIIDKHNWEISVESNLGVGSKFKIIIPISDFPQCKSTLS